MSIALLMSFAITHGMETTPEDARAEDILALQTGDFTQLPDDILNYIITYVNPSHNWDDLDNLCTQLTDIAALNATCTYLNKLTQSDFNHLMFTIKNTVPKFCIGFRLYDAYKSIIPNLILIHALRANKSYKFQSLINISFEMAADVNRCNSPDRDSSKDMSLIHEFDHTPLINAIEYGAPPRIIKLLLKQGADVNSNGYNNNPLLRAIDEAYYYEKEYSYGTKLIKLLIKYGAKVTNRDTLCQIADSSTEWDKTWSTNKLYKNMKKEKEKLYKKITLLLIKHGANPNGIDQSGLPLVTATDYEQTELMKLFIEHGADANQAIKLGQQGYGYRHRTKFSPEHIDRLNEIDAQVKKSKQNGTALPDDYSSDDDSSSSSSESDSDPIIIPPHIPDPHDDGGIFTTTFNRMRINPLLTFSGVVVVGGVCYWAYKKYQAYKAAHKETKQDKQKEDEEAVANQTVEQPITA